MIARHVAGKQEIQEHSCAEPDTISPSLVAWDRLVRRIVAIPYLVSVGIECTNTGCTLVPLAGFSSWKSDLPWLHHRCPCTGGVPGQRDVGADE